ncbi:putative P450 monooxygenase [Myriangium duriaei CBS 260.36]|uniref:P450 monooxygenase n=1 Tax=Myriangium duriaei CBS 260.36 TaxID=1168546 RepID=A0A9P4JA74_9PEZI|nr:putative P450 monooxygenase [Myriangium duriaei CBS 260.36]
MESSGNAYLGEGRYAHLTSTLENRLALVAGGILLLMLATRLLSGLLGSSKKTPRGDTIPLAPYWIPLLGHVPQFFFFRGSFFSWARERYSNGAFALNMFGTTHNVIFKPSLGKMLMDQKNEIVDSHSTSRYIMTAIFAWPKTQLDVYDIALPDFLEAYRHLNTNPGLSKIVDVTVAQLRKNINNLVTFSPSMVDQTWWERTSNAKSISLPGGEQAEEIDLYRLVKDFVGHTAIPSVLGTDFVDNNPEMWSDFWQMDNGFMFLATGLPRWVPIPALTSSVIARRRLVDILKRYEIALDKWTKGEDAGNEWGNLDNVSDLMKARCGIYQKHNLSIEARAAVDLALMWATNANSNPLIFWILCRVYSDSELLEQIRKEVRPYVKVRIPKQEFAIPESPILEDIEHESLTEKCPLLKAAYVESMRLDTAVWSFKIMKEDLTVAGRGKGADSDRFLVEKGTFCHVAHELHHRNPAFYEDPEVWRVDRHIKYEPTKDGGKGEGKADMGTVRPYGGGHSMCKGRQFAFREILMFTATIFTFWDMEPAKGGEWRMPKPVQLTGTNGIKGEMRVRLKRREIPQ